MPMGGGMPNPLESEGFSLAVDCIHALLTPQDEHDEDHEARRRAACIMLASLWDNVYMGPKRSWDQVEVIAKACGARLG